MTIFDAHGVLTFRARHRIRESLKGGGGILYYLYLSSNLKIYLNGNEYTLLRKQDFPYGSPCIESCATLKTLV